MIDAKFNFPSGLSKEEKGQIKKGTGRLILRIIIAALICYMDSLLYQVGVGTVLSVSTSNDRMCFGALNDRPSSSAMIQ